MVNKHPVAIFFVFTHLDFFKKYQRTTSYSCTSTWYYMIVYIIYIHIFSILFWTSFGSPWTSAFASDFCAGNHRLKTASFEALFCIVLCITAAIWESIRFLATSWRSPRASPIFWQWHLWVWWETILPWTSRRASKSMRRPHQDQIANHQTTCDPFIVTWFGSTSRKRNTGISQAPLNITLKTWRSISASRRSSRFHRTYDIPGGTSLWASIHCRPSQPHLGWFQKAGCTHLRQRHLTWFVFDHQPGIWLKPSRMVTSIPGAGTKLEIIFKSSTTPMTWVKMRLTHQEFSPSRGISSSTSLVHSRGIKDFFGTITSHTEHRVWRHQRASSIFQHQSRTQQNMLVSTSWKVCHQRHPRTLSTLASRRASICRRLKMTSNRGTEAIKSITSTCWRTIRKTSRAMHQRRKNILQCHHTISKIKTKLWHQEMWSIHVVPSHMQMDQFPSPWNSSSLQMHRRHLEECSREKNIWESDIINSSTWQLNTHLRHQLLAVQHVIDSTSFRVDI